MANRKRVIALGFFDGVHRGHGGLLNRVGQVAREQDMVATAFTLDSHPACRVSGAVVPLVNSMDDRKYLMSHYYGIEEILVGHFDQSLMELPWQEFVTDYLIRDCQAGCLVAGHDFRFGYRGEGNIEKLKEICGSLGIDCHIIPPVEEDGMTISSTHVRKLISQGDMEQASLFLGHPHMLSHRVTHGKKLGRMLGFPTVNLALPENVIVPSHGVYATRMWLEDGSSKLAVTNVGVRPTVECRGEVSIEGFILDFSGDLYGQLIRMEFHKKLRDEKVFDSLEELTKEVMKNTEQTRAYFSERGRGIRAL